MKKYVEGIVRASDHYCAHSLVIDHTGLVGALISTSESWAFESMSPSSKMGDGCWFHYGTHYTNFFCEQYEGFDDLEHILEEKGFRLINTEDAENLPFTIERALLDETTAYIEAAITLFPREPLVFLQGHFLGILLPDYRIQYASLKTGRKKDSLSDSILEENAPQKYIKDRIYPCYARTYMVYAPAYDNPLDFARKYYEFSR
jgi:hypothetical protein